MGLFPRLLAPLLGFLPLACRLAPPAPAPEGSVVERRLAAMGTWFSLEVGAANRARALQASERAVRALEEVEGRLSTWREDSELARLNRVPVGEPFDLSEELAADLERVSVYWRETGGAFDPGLSALVLAWGLRQGGRSPSSAELERARSARGFASIELHGRTAVRHHDAAGVEEGGFGKGLGLDAAIAALRAAGAERAVLDLGGQIALLGPEPVGCGLADPRDRQRAVLEVRIDRGSLSTSANSERGIVVDGERRSHLLDPRTGQPAPDFGSLSVWASDATAADCLSTGLYVLGPARALEWAREHPGVEVIALEVDQGRLLARVSPGWRGRLSPLVADLEVRFSDLDAPGTNGDALP